MVAGKLQEEDRGKKMTSELVITDEQKETLIHMLGAGEHIRKSLRGYRNHFCAQVGGEDEAVLEQMAALGLVRRGVVINEGTSVYYHVTEAGMQLALERVLHPQEEIAD